MAREARRDPRRPSPQRRGAALRGRSWGRLPDQQARPRVGEAQARPRRADEPGDGGAGALPPGRRGEAHGAQDSVTLEEIDTVTGLVQNLERLELPNQLVAVLADPLLQKLATLRPAAESHRRVANWLGSALRDSFDGDADQATLWGVLEVTRDYVVQTKVAFFPLSPPIPPPPLPRLPLSLSPSSPRLR